MIVQVKLTPVSASYRHSHRAGCSQNDCAHIGNPHVVISLLLSPMTYEETVSECNYK